ncbi:hypothetical protein C8Q77DRAFT_234393 [Trametes polyzona]|nr:hypothetical protein C8Q77DRAFT_234393 [Trametes polyzona]
MTICASLRHSSMVPVAFDCHVAMPSPAQSPGRRLTPSGLGTHICFYRAHPRIATLYDWSRMRIFSGVRRAGKMASVHCNVAVKVVVVDGFCSHLGYGEALLPQNDLCDMYA